MADSSTQHSQINFITSLRGIAAFYVMMSHVWYQIWPAVSPPFGYNSYPEGITALLSGWLYYGHFGVVAFIFISGFCLMIPVMRYNGIQNLGYFFYRRCRRIMPPYYAALLFSLILACTVISEKTGTQWDISIPITWQGIISHILLFQHLLEPTQINYPLWSISVELHLYFLFPLFVIFWRKVGIWGLASFISIIVFSLIAVFVIWSIEDIPPSFLGLIVHFVLGMTCCHIIISGNLPEWLVKISGVTAIALFILLIGVCTALGHERVEETFYAVDLIVISILFCVFIHLSFRKSFTQRILDQPIIIKLGEISYSLYLTHAPVIHLLWLSFAFYNNKVSNFMLLIGISIPTTLAVAYLFYLVFEKPFLSSSLKQK